MSHVKQKLFAVGTLAMALPLASLAGQSAFASTPASANGMSGFVYKCTVKNYNEQTGETDTEPLFTEEQLASLKTLNCLDIEYTPSDVQDWSKGLTKLTGLETLNFNSGSYTFMADALNLSFAPNLKNAFIGGNFSEIDISQNTQLWQLSATSANEITTVKTGNNSSLEYLYLHNNKIETIDLSGMANLKGLSLQNTKISSIDLSANTNLKTLNLSWNNELASLDVSNNTKLESLEIENTAIEILNIENNPLIRILDVNDSQTVTSPARVKKNNSKYEMDLSSLQYVGGTYDIWLPEESEHYQYNSATKTIEFSNLDSVMVNGGITIIYPNSTATFTLSLRPVDIDIIVFLNGEKLPNYSLGDDAKFVGDTWNTEDYTDIINTLYGEDLSLYPTKLASVIARTCTTANGEYTQIGENSGTDDSAPKLSGTLENVERIALIYNYETALASPDTGHNTNQDGTTKASGIVAILTSAVCTAFAIFRIIRRYNKNIKANRS